MNFVSLDVETANSDLASICQIGIVSFIDGKIADKYSILIDPEDYFSAANISVHGIEAATVRGALNFEDASYELFKKLAGQIVATHTPFDRTAIARAAGRYSVKIPDIIWIDTAKVARRAWGDVAQSGFGLSNLAKKFGIEFKHHDACEDARVAGIILLEAIKATNIDLEGWLRLLAAPYHTIYKDRISKDGNPDGPLFGEVMVFTGSLKFPRSEAAELAAKLGCKVIDGVTRQTTILVVGDNDARDLNGHSKSSKHRKAETMIADGAQIKILTEKDFMTIVADHVI